MISRQLLSFYITSGRGLGKSSQASPPLPPEGVLTHPITRGPPGGDRCCYGFKTPASCNPEETATQQRHVKDPNVVAQVTIVAMNLILTRNSGSQSDKSLELAMINRNCKPKRMPPPPPPPTYIASCQVFWSWLQGNVINMSPLQITEEMVA